MWASLYRRAAAAVAAASPLRAAAVAAVPAPRPARGSPAAWLALGAGVCGGASLACSSDSGKEVVVAVDPSSLSVR